MPGYDRVLARAPPPTGDRDSEAHRKAKITPSALRGAAQRNPRVPHFVLAKTTRLRATGDPGADDGKKHDPMAIIGQEV